MFAFKHALDALLNQGILTSIYTLGSVIVLIGSVIYIGEEVKFCEYLGTVLIIVGTVVISMTKKDGDITQNEIVATEGP